MIRWSADRRVREFVLRTCAPVRIRSRGLGGPRSDDYGTASRKNLALFVGEVLMLITRVCGAAVMMP